MYTERLRRNFRKVIEKHGFPQTSRVSGLESITSRHVHNVVTGSSNINVFKLEEVADEIGADMMEFFEE